MYKTSNYVNSEIQNGLFKTQLSFVDEMKLMLPED